MQTPPENNLVSSKVLDNFTLNTKDLMLTAMEFGDEDCFAVYIKLLCMQWANGFIVVENNLPQYGMQDKQRLAAIWQIIKHKFILLSENHYINKIIHQKRSRKLSISEKRSNIGKNGINKRWGNKTEEPRKPKNKLLPPPPSNTIAPVIDQPPHTLEDATAETKKIIELTVEKLQQPVAITNTTIATNVDLQGKMFEIPPIIPDDNLKPPPKPPKPPTPNKREWFAAEIEKHKSLCDDEKILQTYLDYYCNLQFNNKMYFETLRNFSVQRTLQIWVENNKPKNINTNARNSTGAANLNSKTIQPRPPGSYGKPQRNSIVL